VSARTRVPVDPNPNSVAESELRRIAGAWGQGRAKSFRNAERTNRLLKLMVLVRRGDYDERLWAEVIDRVFTARRERVGRPGANLRTVSDHKVRGVHHPSLR